jgi:ATP synthase protein I
VSPLPDVPREPDRKSNADWGRAVREAAPLLGIGSTLALTVALGVGLGFWADRRWGTTPFLTLAGAILGLVMGMYGFIKTVTGKKR